MSVDAASSGRDWKFLVLFWERMRPSKQKIFLTTRLTASRLAVCRVFVVHEERRTLVPTMVIAARPAEVIVKTETELPRSVRGCSDIPRSSRIRLIAARYAHRRRCVKLEFRRAPHDIAEGSTVEEQWLNLFAYGPFPALCMANKSVESRAYDNFLEIAFQVFKSSLYDRRAGKALLSLS